MKPSERVATTTEMEIHDGNGYRIEFTQNLSLAALGEVLDEFEARIKALEDNE